MYDVFISGGGPAGIVLAMQLKRYGLSVLLAGSARRFASLEGMAERGRQALQSAGCEQALAALGPQVHRRAMWSGKEFSGNHEYLVERVRLDEALWADARDAGVETRRERVGKITWHANHWQIGLTKGIVAARYRVEARGRQAPRPPDSHQAPRTLGLAAWWESPKTNPKVKPTAGVCTHADGWCWYARLADGRLNLQMFIDVELQTVPSRVNLREYYLQLVNACSEAKSLSTGMQLASEPCARGANLILSMPLIGDFAARVGDAALALDPLAGHGMFEALGGAMTLAPCIRTELQRPQDSSLAQDFYRRRMQDEFWHFARNGRDFYALETRWSDRPFWLSRQQWPDAEPTHPAPQPGIGRIETRPVSVDGFIEQRELLVCPDMPRGAWQVDGIPLVPLLLHLGSSGIPEPEKLRDISTAAGWPIQSTESAIRWLAQRELLNLAVVSDDIRR